MIRLKIRKRIAQLNKEAIVHAEKGDMKKAAELLLRINECENILKILK
jgi:hypothetical protein